MDFQGKTVWITGASSGIGEGLAYALAARGAKLILSARNEAALGKVAEACVARGSTVPPLVLPLDLADLDSLPGKAEEARARVGQLDILVNNGGVGQRGYVLDTAIAVHQRVMQVNYFGQIALTKAVLPSMVARRSGHIVVVSSLSGKLPVPGRSAYCASKHALHGFFDALRGEVYAYNIKVTIVCPGFVHTRISENALLPDGSPRGGKADKDHRNAMTPAQSAEHILYAIRKGKDEYYYGGKEKWAVTARRFLPGVYARAIRRVRLAS